MTWWTDPDQLFVHYTKNTSPMSMVRHQHPRHEIYYLLSGERDYFVRDTVYRVRSGDVVVIPAYDLHKTHPVQSQGYERFLVEFSDSVLAGVAGAVEDARLMEVFQLPRPVLTIPGTQRAALQGLFTRLVEERTEAGIGSSAALQGLLLEILVILARVERSAGSSSLPAASPTHQLVSQISRFLTEHFDEPWDLTRTAAHFGLSSGYLSRLFPIVVGTTFQHYRLHQRIQKAQQWLRETDMSVAQISERLGFSSQTSFGRAFLRLVGVPPLRYRSRR